MNPFGWRGPEFLAFYLVFATALLLWQWYRGRSRESERPTTAKPNLTDPYLIAYLRGGKNELLRVVSIALIERGLIDSNEDGTLRSRARTMRDTPATTPVERYVLDYFNSTQPAYKILKATPNAVLQAAFDQYERHLGEAGLITDRLMRAARFADAAQVCMALCAVGVIKLWIAIAAGRHNIGFLIVLMGISFIASILISRSGRITRAGKEALADMQVLFAGMPTRQGMSPAEVALTAAVFGMAVLPGIGVAYGNRLYPQASASSSSGSSCGSNSSCGSSSSGGDSGGGSSCGGGGGCGGCGGGGGD